MPERHDKPAKDVKDVMETVPRIIGNLSTQLEQLQEAVSLNPSDNEMTAALGNKATPGEREAYRQGHQSGWYKGALMFGCAVLAGLAVMTLATSKESDEPDVHRQLRG